MALVPTMKITGLPPGVLPLSGSEALEAVQVGTSVQIPTRAFALPTDSLLTVTGMGGSLPGSRQLIQGVGIGFVDGGAGSTLMIFATGAVAGPADPTALVGLTAVNGVALTYMRSDAAPALDQSIVPTWTGLHTFGANLVAANADPYLRINETDAAANNRVWDFGAVGEQFRGRVWNDALGASTNWLEVDRTLNVVDIVNLMGTSVRANGSPILTAATAFANPTALVGLVAVNGVATTAMRSDAAPALDQAIVPTWTAQHTYTLSGATNAAIFASSAQPQFDWNETDAAANNRRWRIEVNGEQQLFRVVNDANSAAVTWMAIDRTLNVVDTIALTSTALTWNGNPILSTGTAFANPSGTVGLATVNGVATTAMRSDAAPPLSQAIAPTWSAAHTFQAQVTYTLTGATNAAIFNSSAQPQIDWNETDGAANNRRWRFEVQGEQFIGLMVNDANNATGAWVTIDRTANVADQIVFTATGVASSNATIPILRLSCTGAAADRKNTLLRTGSTGEFAISLSSDAAPDNPVTNAMNITRTGTTVSSVIFPTATLTSFLVGTTASVDGSTNQAEISAAAGDITTLLLKNSPTTAAIVPLKVWNNQSAGDNGFITFNTEAARTNRGSIDYNRAGGVTRYNTTSDERLKTNIRDSEDSGPIIDRIRIRAFDWKDSEAKQSYWLVAQELYAVYPHAVSKGDDGAEITKPWAVDPTQLVPLLTKEIQMLRIRVAELEGKTLH